MRTRSAAPGRQPVAPLLAAAALAGLVVLALLIAFAAAPYLFAGTTLRSEIAAQLRATTGLVISSKGQARFALLPRPHVVMADLHIADPTGTLAIDADALDGEVRLLPLLFGRLELTSATLHRPRLVIDFDGRPMRPDSTIGRALRATSEPPGGQRLGTVTLVDGSAILKSKTLRDPPTFDHVNITLDWRNLDAPATLTGSLAMRDTLAEVAAWVAQPSSLMRGEPSAMALQVHSAPLDLSANGTLVDAETARFKGNVSATSPSLPDLIALGGARLAPLAPFADLGLGGEAILVLDKQNRVTLDLAGLRLRLDGNDYEGSLAFQQGAASSLSGTLATERLSLGPFLRRAPALNDGTTGWARRPLTLDAGDPMDLDLRVSATHLVAAPVTIDDAALAVMTRNGRTEVSLVEGKAYGGAIKARLSVGFSPDGLSIRGTGSIIDADASSLSWDAFGRQLAAGTLSASCSLETAGHSPAEMAAHLQGWAKGRAADGEISGIDLARGLNAARDKAPDAVLPMVRAGRTAFNELRFGLRFNDGIAAVDEASMSGPKATLTLAGRADVGLRELDLRATAAQPAAAADGTPASFQFDVEGSFDKVIVAPIAGARTPAPP